MNEYISRAQHVLEIKLKNSHITVSNYFRSYLMCALNNFMTPQPETSGFRRSEGKTDVVSEVTVTIHSVCS